MSYRLTCDAKAGIRINSLGLSLNYGQSYECTKPIYDSNLELQALVKQGVLKVSIKSNGLVARAGTPTAKVSNNVKEVHHHHHQGMDMEALASLLIERLSGVISSSGGAPMVGGSQAPVRVNSEEPLVFIPSKILSDTDKVSTTPLASETSSENSDALSDALSALKALRKANKT